MIIYPPYPPSAPRPLSHLPRETSDCADQTPLPAYTATWPVLMPPHQAQGLGLCWTMPRSCGIPKFPKQKLKDYKTLMWFNDHVMWLKLYPIINVSHCMVFCDSNAMALGFPRLVLVPPPFLWGVWSGPRAETWTPPMPSSSARHFSGEPAPISRCH